MENSFTWNDSLSTGYNEIDLQHKKLLLVINQVHNALQLEPEQYRLKMAKVFKDLTDYTVYHFDSEEKFMRLNGYPDIEEHRKEHQAFVNKVNSQLQYLSDGNRENGMQFYTFLGNWLIHHIAEKDQLWAGWLHNHGKQE
jgi:hemerythrin